MGRTGNIMAGCETSADADLTGLTCAYARCSGDPQTSVREIERLLELDFAAVLHRGRLGTAIQPLAATHEGDICKQQRIYRYRASSPTVSDLRHQRLWLLPKPSVIFAAARTTWLASIGQGSRPSYNLLTACLRHWKFAATAQSWSNICDSSSPHQHSSYASPHWQLSSALQDVDA